MTDLSTMVLQPTAEFDRAIRAQAQAADPERSAWVEANAGSGKTKVLIDRVARLLLKRPDGRLGAEPESILCVTYTKAAANEMLSRLFERLGTWSVANDEDLRASLAGLEGRLPEAYSPEDLREARSLFARALETPGGLRIETIHAFCARILRRFPLEAGVSPGFVEIEDAEADALWRAVLSAHIEAASAAHPKALAILSRAAGGFGAMAAIGALKSCRQALYAFSSRLEREDIDDPDRLIRAALGAPDMSCEALLEKAMGEAFPLQEIRGAIAALDGAVNPAPDKDKTNKKLLAKLQNVLSHSDPRAKYEAYLDAIAGASHDWPERSNPYSGKALSGSVVETLFSRDFRKGVPEGLEITRMKAVQESLRALEAAERTRALMKIGLPILQAYRREKQSRAALDFDDLITYTRQLLTQRDMTPWVLYKLDGGISHILLDEAQDTSPPQWDLINALTAEFGAGLGAAEGHTPRTQFTVGDPKQSIYSFQGADQQYFEQERLDFIAREAGLGIEASLPEMTMSFRSSPEILDFVDEVAATTPLKSAVTDRLPPRDADLPPHVARRVGQPGRVELWPLCMPLKQEGESDNWLAPPDHLPKDAPRRRLADLVAASIKRMIEQGEAVWRETARGRWARVPLQPQDVLILVRRRGDLFDALIDSLKAKGLPVAGADRLKLLDNIGVQDCLNLIRFALQPGDDLVLAEILRGPFCGLTDDDHHLFPLAYKRAPGETLYDRLSCSQDPVFAEAKAFAAELLERRHQSAFAFLNHFLGRRAPNGLTQLISRLGEPVREPVTALLQRALRYDMGAAASLQAFLSDMEADQAELKRDLSEPQGAVRVMTVHGAKGLQAPLVILPDTTSITRKSDDQIFFGPEGTPLYSPSSSQDSAAIQLAREQKNMAQERESRRLLYVAMTRAQDRLIICGAGESKPAIGYGESSWYRWCLLAMRYLQGASGDEGETLPSAPEEMLTYGPAPVISDMRETNATATTVSGDHVPAWLDRSAPAPSQGQKTYAPSLLVKDSSRVLAPLDAARRFSLRRGRLIHALLQTLPELDPAQREARATRFLDQAADLTAAQRNEIHTVTFQTLEAPSFKEIFSKDGRSEAAIIGRLPNGLAINGRVDRLLVAKDQVLIIDYKTDRPAPDRPEDVGEAYLAQMAAYRAILQQIYKDGRPVRCALLYTDGPRLIELGLDLLSESLKRLKSEV